jgi:pilus assembly protein CpaE
MDDDALTVQVVGETDVERGQVRACLGQLAQPKLQLVEGSPEIKGGRPRTDVVALMVGENPAAALDCLLQWTSLSPQPLLIVFRSEWPLDLMRQMLHAGANEVVALPPAAGELELIFLKLAESRNPRDKGNALGRVYAVTGLAGGVGLSTVAAGLALALRYAMNRRVALVDLDLQRGGINLSLHLDPVETIVSLVPSLERLDSTRLEAALTKHPAGIYLLAAPIKIEQADLVTEEAVAAILDLMRQLFDVVIVDCGRRVSRSSMAAWERCAQALYVTDQSLWNARRVPRFMQYFSSLELSGVDVRLVVNRFDARSGAKHDELAKGAQAPIFACLPRDDRLMDMLQMHNEDLWRLAPSSRLARAFEDLGRAVDSPDSPAPRGIVSRFMNAIGVGA